MSAQPNRRSLLARLSRLLFFGFGAVAILLAVALGLFRLLLGQIPDYQTELRAWVADEIGLAVDFSGIDARLGPTGPELTLHGASIGSGSDFLEADEVRITLDPIALLGRRIELSRLTLERVSLIIERDVAGVLRVGNFALGRSGDAFVASIPEAVEVAIRDGEVRYIDAGQDRTFVFSDLNVLLESAGGRYRADATVSPPQELAASLHISFDGMLRPVADAPVSWQLQVVAGALDLASLQALLPYALPGPIAGYGSVGLELDWTGPGMSGLSADVNLEGVSIGDDPAAPFELVSLAADWRRTDASRWQLGLSDLAVRRNGRNWNPSSAFFALETDNDGVSAVELTAAFLRLADLEPIVAAFPDTQLAEQWALFGPTGEISDLNFALRWRNGSLDYDLDADFVRLAVSQVGSTPGIDAMSGHVQATERSGTIDFDSDTFSVSWPTLFRDTLYADSLTGAVLWRQGRDEVSILSANLGIGVLGREATASFDLKLPRDGSSPRLDLRAEVDRTDLVPAKAYLPTEIMPGAVVAWLDQAVLGGRARNIELEMFGPLEAFPFDANEGQFRVTADIERATLDYMTDWPIGENIDGRVEFANAGFFARASGSAGGNRSENFRLSIPDMRRPLMTMEMDTYGELVSVVSYLRTAPLIAATLGTSFDRIDADDGMGSVSVRLDLPLQDRSRFELDAALAIRNGAVRIRGFGPPLSELNGTLLATERGVTAEGIEGILLDGPFKIALTTSEQPGYRAELLVEGETSAAAVAGAFSWQHEDLVDGQALWNGRLMLPSLDPLATSPPRISIQSNLAGVALRFPEPLTKAPSAPSNLAIDLVFATGSRLDMTGNVGATRRFAFEFDIDEQGIDFSSGTITFGGEDPQLPNRPGVLVNGQIEALQLDDWLALTRNAGLERAGALFLGADVDVAALHAFGQQLGETSLRVTRRPDNWEISVDSAAIAGEVSVPRNTGRRSPIIVDMDRFYLAAAGEGNLDRIDPASLPGLTVRAREFGFGNRQFGSMTAEIEPAANGLLLSQFQSRTANFSTSASGSWLSSGNGSRTALTAEIRSSDVSAALAELGLDPVIEGEAALVNADVYWQGAPTGAWLDHLFGDVSLFVETGTLREVDPGAGRVVGLMSIAALPRRLLLDFRDVFEEGFAFDEIGGTFRLFDGDAYTNDLKFGGPAAEIGVVGRTGLRDRDYRQQVVVTAEPSNMLPTVGGLLGGAGVGAALLIFTRLFKEPLKGIGRASYCLTGSWESPQVAPIDQNESDEALRCAELPSEMQPELIDE